METNAPTHDRTASRAAGSRRNLQHESQLILSQRRDFQDAKVAELVDARDLGSRGGPPPWGFESPLSHTRMCPSAPLTGVLRGIFYFGSICTRNCSVGLSIDQHLQVIPPTNNRNYLVDFGGQTNFSQYWTALGMKRLTGSLPDEVPRCPLSGLDNVLP